MKTNKNIKKDLISVLKNKSTLTVLSIALVFGIYILFQSNLFIKEQELNEFSASTSIVLQNLGRIYNTQNCKDTLGNSSVNLKFGKNLAFFGQGQPSQILSVSIGEGFSDKYEISIPNQGVLDSVKVGACIDVIKYKLTYNKELTVREKVSANSTSTTGEMPIYEDPNNTSSDVVGQAFNAYGCTNETGYSTTNLKVGNNALPYPAGTRNGLSSFILNSDFKKGIANFKSGNKILYTATESVGINKCINIPSSANDKITSVQIEAYPSCGSKNGRVLMVKPQGTGACNPGSIVNSVEEKTTKYYKKVKFGLREDQVRDVLYEAYTFNWGCKVPSSPSVVYCESPRLKNVSTGFPPRLGLATERCIDTNGGCSLPEFR